VQYLGIQRHRSPEAAQDAESRDLNGDKEVEGRRVQNGFYEELILEDCAQCSTSVT
jgi:hypothetical protein